MMETLPFIGTPLFCVECGRQLVSFNPDGTFNLAGMASINGSAEAVIDEYGQPGPPAEMVVTGATCYRRPCRLKRWLQSHNPRRK